jgi:hypothetical protein
LIADANRKEVAFPLDLLDARPIVEEALTVVHPGLSARTARLIEALGQLGTTQLGHIGPGGGGQMQLFGTLVIVQYTAATTRAAMLERIRNSGFQLLSSFAWPFNAGTAEALTFADPRVKQDWNDLVALLARVPGIERSESLDAGETLRVKYNTAQIGRAAILGQIERKGFFVVTELSRQFDRVGAQIVIPQNQAT